MFSLTRQITKTVISNSSISSSSVGLKYYCTVGKSLFANNNDTRSTFKKNLSYNQSQQVYDKPLRRVLFNVPGNDQRKVSKAVLLSSQIDSIVLDIEDGVAVNMKQQARDEIVRSVMNDTYQHAELLVRVNSVESGLLEEDIKAISKVSDYIDGILLPKCEHPTHIQYLLHLLKDNGVHERKRLLASIESAVGLINMKEICSYNKKEMGGDDEPSQLEALVFASEDYCADTGITRTPGALEMLYARSAVVNHSIAFGLQAIDMVCINFKDEEFLRKEVNDGVRMGFHGKQAIHPNQIEVICNAFRPTLPNVEFATKIVEANEDNQSKGIGAFQVDGKMIDMPMVKWAHNILALEAHYPPRDHM